MRYPELNALLRSLKRNSISFTLDALNELLNGKLPNCARKYPQVNFSNGKGNSYSEAWVSAGFNAKYTKSNDTVTFYRVGEGYEVPERAKKPKKEKVVVQANTLLIKNFSGSFNENGIGHEIINAFDSNNNKNSFYPFYVPPYGSIASEKIAFIKEPIYRGFKKILVFDSTTITNVLKLKAVILDPIPLNSEQEMKTIASQLCYGPNNTPLNQINFNDIEFQKDRIVKITLFPFTYKVTKTKYFNLEDHNIFIWHKRTAATNKLKDDSLRKFHIVYGEDGDITALDETSLGEKNYSYNTLGSDLETWFTNKVKPLLKEENLYKLKPVPKALHITYRYSRDNFLEYVKKLTDENLYTNFICSILNSNDTLKNLFFTHLVEKYFGVKNYKPSNLVVQAQCQALITPKKLVNNYLKAKKEDKSTQNQIKETLINEWHITAEQIDSITEKFIDGQMDLYLYDDNYRIAIENKILSGINGKHDDIDEDIDQLKTYKTFLNDLNTYNLDNKTKQNKVLLLTPKSIANNFVNYDSEVPVMSYRDLAEFFTKNQQYIIQKYRSDFLNAIYKHSVTREEDVTIRFFEALQ